MKLWEKNFEINKEIERFTVGRDREMDLYLAPYDVLGSMAHITMLESIGLLERDELTALLAELKNIYALCERGEFTIEDIKIASYKEIFFSDEEMADRWYKAKLQFITIDEKTEKEKRSNVNYLVQAGTLKGAVGNIESVMGTTMIDYVIASVAETTLMDVFEYGKEKHDDKPEYEG